VTTSVENRELLKFKLTIAYDGTGYEGWQVQKIGTGVQQKIEEAFQKIYPSVRRIHSSSRTDTGVHARAMIAHVEIPRAVFRMPVRKLALAINAHLPADIRIIRAVRCPAAFHARFDATGKQYRYSIWNDTVMNPLLNRAAWHVPRLLDIDAMQRAAKHFVGRKDFKSLASNREYEMASTVRSLTRCDVQKRGPLITLVIVGDGFLYKMCRTIAGTLAMVGHEKLRPADVKKILAEKDRRAGGVTAPAKGLVLWQVYYNGPKKERP
jgi:tRNA pseudouridine38-40 synthase